MIYLVQGDCINLGPIYKKIFYDKLRRNLGQSVT